MFRRFLRDSRGNYALMTVVLMVPLMGALALAIDFSQMTRQRQLTLNALDAAGIATARRIVEGATDEELDAYAKEFFKANLNGVDASSAVIKLVLPQNNSGGGTLKLTAEVPYKPYFFGPFAELMGDTEQDALFKFSAESEVRLKNTLEVALALDNSGSMDYIGLGSGKKRMVLLKEAAKQLVDTIAAEGALLKQVNKPVQFGLVPFASAVNVGASNKTATWMDQDGISPIHHENFDWTAFTATNKKVQMSGGVYRKKGSDWGAEENQKVTRFTLFDEMKRQTGTQSVKTGTQWGCVSWYWWGGCRYYGYTDVYEDVPVYSSFSDWYGCVEARPYPYNVNDTAPSTATPATLFVPWFSPDETDKKDSWNRSTYSNWWKDLTNSSSSSYRQGYAPKYFDPASSGTSYAGKDAGPNTGCTTNAITPLTDVGTTAGMTKIKDAIDAMEALGGTNAVEGLAWGWRVVSSAQPFTEGRTDGEKGNDKVVIVLTDGANTYYTPESLGYNDLAGNKSIYSAHGYTGKTYSGGSTTRLFLNTSSAVSKSDYSNGNYTKALNEQFATLCDNAKSESITIMTVSLDLSATDATEKAQMDALEACASDSKFRKNGTKPAKLYWNATGSNLAEKFKEIADELSNLRIVS